MTSVNRIFILNNDLCLAPYDLAIIAIGYLVLLGSIGYTSYRLIKNVVSPPSG